MKFLTNGSFFSVEIIIDALVNHVGIADYLCQIIFFFFNIRMLKNVPS
jgi:hypothetical protein